MTYVYHLLVRPHEESLNTLAAQGWRVIQAGTDPRDGTLAWALLEQETPVEPKPSSARAKGGSNGI